MRILSCLITTAFLLCSCTNTQSAHTNQFVDSRDQHVYEVVTVGDQDWLGADLKYQTPTSFCYDNEEENCQKYGRLYSLPEAQMACPNGWRLPTEMDWRTLEQTLGMKPSELEAIRVWRGDQEGTLLAEQLGVKFSGIGRSRGRDFLGKDQFVYYWVDEPGPSGKQFSLYRMVSNKESRIYSDQVPKMDLCCVRCVRDD